MPLKEEEYYMAEKRKLESKPKRKRKRYRYIWGGMSLEELNEPVSCWGLIGYPWAIGCIRITIPDDMVLYKERDESYSTTRDSRTLMELEAVPVLMIDGRYRTRPDLLKVPTSSWKIKLMEEGMRIHDGEYLSRELWEKLENFDY